MSAPTPTGLADPLLTPVEARILACLMEKQRTTPEQYPLTLNALANACNQKSSRHPVMCLGNPRPPKDRPIHRNSGYPTPIQQRLAG